VCPQQTHRAATAVPGAWSPEGRHSGTGKDAESRAGAGGLEEGVNPSAPESWHPRTAQIPPNAQSQLTPKRLPPPIKEAVVL